MQPFYLQLNDDTVLAIAPITQTSSELISIAKASFTAQVFENCMKLVDEMSAEAKRAERLSVRLLLHQVLTNQYSEMFAQYPMPLMEYNHRCPLLVGGNKPLEISISHTAGWVGIVVSKSKRLGLDMEMVSYRAQKVRHKFLSEDENRFIDGLAVENQHIGLTLYWTAKEALFKFYQKGNVNFIDNLHVGEFTNINSGSFSGTISILNSTIDLLLNYQTLPIENKQGLIVCWCTE